MSNTAKLRDKRGTGVSDTKIEVQRGSVNRRPKVESFPLEIDQEGVQKALETRPDVLGVDVAQSGADHSVAYLMSTFLSLGGGHADIGESASDTASRQQACTLANSPAIFGGRGAPTTGRTSAAVTPENRAANPPLTVDLLTEAMRSVRNDRSLDSVLSEADGPGVFINLSVEREQGVHRITGEHWYDLNFEMPNSRRYVDIDHRTREVIMPRTRIRVSGAGNPIEVLRQAADFAERQNNTQHAPRGRTASGVRNGFGGSDHAELHTFLSHNFSGWGVGCYIHGLQSIAIGSHEYIIADIREPNGYNYVLALTRDPLSMVTAVPYRPVEDGIRNFGVRPSSRSGSVPAPREAVATLLGRLFRW